MQENRSPQLGIQGFLCTGIIGGDGRRASWEWGHIWGLDVAHHQGLAFESWEGHVRYDVVCEFLNSCVFFSFVAFPCILSCAYLSTDVSRRSGLTMKRGGTAS